MHMIDIDSRTRFQRARLARDARFDGLFFIAVRTTGIYCRPICPAPTAKEANVDYFEHSAAAAASGYRPCLRCRPELAPGRAPCDGNTLAFELAWQRVRDGALNEMSVAQLADEIGLSERQLRRQFVQHVGAAPLAVHTTQRLLLAKQLLTETRLPVTDIAFASGYRSLRRFNQAFVEGCGMPPSRLRVATAENPGETIRLKLVYRPPYDFAGILDFLATRAIDGLEQVDAVSYRRVLGPADAPAWVNISQASAPNTLLLQIEAQHLPLLPDVIRRVRRLFDLDAQPDAIARVFATDPLLASAVQAAPGIRVPGAFDGFETAVRAVLGQQVSVAGARTLCTRLVHAWGASVSTAEAANTRLFPTATVLADADVKSIGMPTARANSIRTLARAARDGEIDLERMQPLAAFVDLLCTLPGIGPWTAHYIAMRCLHHPDAYPAGDLVVRKQLGVGEAISTADAERRAETWRPWRSYAVMHLWRLSAIPSKKKT